MKSNRSNHKLNILIGGEAGQGIQSIGFILSKCFARGGYHIFADQDFESRIRGGHSFFRIRISLNEIGALNKNLDLLVALNNESIDLHKDELAQDGLIIGGKLLGTYNGEKHRLLTVPFEELAMKAGGTIMANTVAIGAVLAIIDYDINILNKILTEQYSKKGKSEANIKAALLGYEFVKKNYDIRSEVVPLENQPRRLLINGNEALALGAIAAGCRFVSSYPMTPSTSIFEYFAQHADEIGAVVIQAEDEIAAINNVIGANYVGVRAMTTTSGSGFCLMVEGLGLAGITETPCVIVNAQRPGPAVGLPTRTEQGDLLFVIHAHHGEFPRAVLTPASIVDCFWVAVKAFNLADKYQTPVIILTDQHLASSYTTAIPFDYNNVVIERGELLSSDSIQNPSKYKRHLFTSTGISPRVLPGARGAIVVTDADEHNEAGHMIEDAETRTAMVRKRLNKIKGIEMEKSIPKYYGSQNADIRFIGWGSTRGAIMEAVNYLNSNGKRANMLHLNQVWPFPKEQVSEFLKKAHISCCVENNATGQLARLIHTETGFKPDHNILKFDGRPFTSDYIIKDLEGFI
jgi:2-oxoglutarate ferredoxin oxidoreductase subunit alpha